MTLLEWSGLATTAGLGIMAAAKFLQTRKNDARTARSSATSDQLAGTDQIIKGLNDLLDQNQETLKDARDTIKDSRQVIELLEVRIRADRVEREATLAELSACRTENARLRRKYGNGNNDTPNPPTKEKP